MVAQPESNRSAINRIIVICLASLIILIGLCVLIGWGLDISILKRIHPSFKPMQANSAICFLLLGIALSFYVSKQLNTVSRTFKIFFVCIVLCAALLTLCEYFFHLDFKIDQLFFKDLETSAEFFPGRMSPLTTTCFALSALALFFLDNKKSIFLSHFLSMIVFTLAGIVFLNYFYGVSQLFGWLEHFSHMATHTAFAFLLLAIGILCADHNQGAMKYITAYSNAGSLTRRMLPVTILLPPLLGWVVLAGEKAGFFEARFVVSIVVVILIIIFASLVLAVSKMLYNQESRFQNTLEAANAMVLVNRQRKIILINRQAETLFGYTRQELIGQPIERLIPTRFHAKHPEFVESFFLNPQARAMGAGRELFGLKKDGREVPIEIGLNPFAVDRETFVLASIIDITERKKEQDRLFLIAEATPVATILVDQNHKVVFANKECEKLFGYSKQEMEGQNINLLIPQRFHEKHHVETKDYMQSPHIRPSDTGVELFAHKKDGSEIAVDISLNPVKTAGGLFVIASIVDITERKKRRDQQFNSHLAAIVDATEDAVLSKDLNGDITTWNKGAERLYGYTAEEIKGKSILTIVPQELQSEIPLFLEKIKRGESIKIAETKRIRKDGSQVDVSISISPMKDWQGRVTAAAVVAHNITEQKLIEERLRLQAAALNAAANAVTITNKSGHFLWVNPAFTQVTGYSFQDVQGKTPRILKSGHHDQQFYQEMWKHITNGEVWHHELINRRKDGGLYRSDLTITPVHDEKGEISHYIGISQDITERNRLENLRIIQFELTKLLNSQKHFDENIPDILKLISQRMDWDFSAFWSYEDGEKIFKSTHLWARNQNQYAAFESITKLIKVEKGNGIIGQTAKENRPLWIEEIRDCPAFLRKSLADKNNLHTAFCFPVMRHDFVYGVFEFFSQDVRKTHEMTVQAAHVMGELMGRVIEREHTQEEIILAHQKMEQLLASIPSIIIGVDYEGKIIHFNQVAERVLSQSSDEILNRPLAECGFTWAKSHILKAVEICRAENKIVPLDDVPFERVDKQWGLLGFTLFPMQSAKGKTEVLMFGADITLRRKSEQELRQARDLALQASRAKTDFLATMSHEIRTPMNAIVGMAELLSETSLNRDQKEYVEVLKRGGDNLLNLINDILDLSKVESGLLELEETDFNLRDFLERTIEFMAVRAHQKGLELNCHVANELPIILIGDANRLRQVIINLLGNAIKFTEKGEVSVKVQYAPNSQQDDLSCDLLFEVHDTGIGIPQDKLELIFEPFTQADSSTTRRFGGSGLGLSISRKLVSLMGGKIWVSSKTGEGATFHFIVRLGVRRKTKKVVEENTSSLKGIKALVVDDSAANRFILKETLQEWGMIIQEAVGGRECLEEIKRAKEKNAPYQVLLLDCRMPGLGGFDVAKAVKEDPELASLVIMMLTSDSRSGDVALSKKLNLSGYLVKPIKRAELMQVLLASIQKTGSETKKSQTEPSTVPIHPLNILVVEDAEDNRLLINAFFKGTPHRLTFAENGLFAVEKFEKGSYDLIFMDMHMPVMDGYEATRKIRLLEKQKPKGRQVTIVALTADVIKDNLETTLKSGCDLYLTKPVKKSALFEVVNKCAVLSGNKK